MTPQPKSILVTGCSSGIGRYCALHLHDRGWKVFATARKPQDILDLRQAGLKAYFLDYADQDSIHKAFENVLEATGGTLDALFNNGAYAQAGAVEDLPTSALREQFEANFFGWHALTRLAIPTMRKQGHGRLVFCSSILGVIPLRWRGAYNASKFALEGLVSTLRLELRDSGIHVSLVEPGPIESKFGQNSLPYFENNIDIDNSIHRDLYKDKLREEKAGGRPNRFRLGPDAVFAKLVQALESDRPKPHYPVTTPTRFMFAAKRLLPQTWIDYILVRSD